MELFFVHPSSIQSWCHVPSFVKIFVHSSKIFSVQLLSVFSVIIWLCLTRTGNYRIHEFDWLKSILKAVLIFTSRPASRPVAFCKLKCKHIDYFYLAIFIYGNAKKPAEKKSKEDEQTLAEFDHSQAECQLVQTSGIKLIKLFLFAPYIKHLIN